MRSAQISPKTARSLAQALHSTPRLQHGSQALPGRPRVAFAMPQICTHFHTPALPVPSARARVITIAETALPSASPEEISLAVALPESSAASR